MSDHDLLKKIEALEARLILLEKFVSSIEVVEVEDELDPVEMAYRRFQQKPRRDA